MEGVDALPTIAEMAIGLAGFSAVVAAFTIRGELSQTDRSRFLLLFTTAFVAALLAGYRTPFRLGRFPGTLELATGIAVRRREQFVTRAVSETGCAVGACTLRVERVSQGVSGHAIVPVQLTILEWRTISTVGVWIDVKDPSLTALHFAFGLRYGL